MASLIYSMLMSLDGYIADTNGKFTWAEPDEEVHTFFNQLERPVGTYLYGRRMFEVMRAWEALGSSDQPAFIRDFASMWRATEKIVFSKSLATVTTSRTRIERAFKPEAIREMKAAASQDITIGGPHLAAEAFKAGLVDVCHFFVAPVIVGGGTSAFPAGVRLTLSLQGERRFGNGMAYVHYRAVHGDAA